MSIQQAIDNKPLIQQIVANLNTGKSSDNIFESTGYESTDPNLPARNFIQALLVVWFNHNGHYCNWQFRKSFLNGLSLSGSLGFLSKLPKEHYDLLPPYVLTKVKQQNQFVDNTIVEHELAKLYSEVNPDPVQVANAHDFVKQIDQVYDTIKSKLIWWATITAH